MASRWRIRHKLMLGLGLVLATIALLQGGTLRSLWSYYLTMNSIRSKTLELKAAERFKEAVADIVRWADRRMDAVPERPAEPVAPPPSPFRLPPEPEANDSTGRKHPTSLRTAIAEARVRLDQYETQLQDTLSHGRDPLHGEHPLGLIEVLRKNLEALEKANDQLKAEPVMGAQASDRDVEDKGRSQLRQLTEAIERNADDLCIVIHDDLHQRINESRNHYQVALWITIPASVAGLLLVCSLLRSFFAWVFYPIRDLEAGVGRIAKGDFAHRVDVASGDEMEELGAAFNNMIEQLQHLYSDLARQVNERSRQLVRSERLASVGFLAAGVAHEINNPLASIAFCSEALEARLGELLRQARATGRPSTPEEEVFGKYLKMIQEEAFRCKNITERLLAFSRSGEPGREPVDLRELVQSVLDVTQHLPTHRGKELRFEMAAPAGAGRTGAVPVTAWINAEEIKQVVLNLVVNALDSMDEGGRLTIRLSQRGDMAELRFTDTGCGMTQEVLENIFEPFFTRSRTGKGTGLGLTISHRIITHHGGEIEASSPGVNQGSTFVVRLPVKPSEAGEGEEGPDVRSLADARRPTSGKAA